ncbi:unnamed protein product [Durusdinium trenchii]|uniref:Uncharacterized protein n=1 Tax=Durusdinium trenchii TaxID=1381693 RepID=A0ABP0P835_9DINO
MASTCSACSQYPRVLNGVLDESDVRHFRFLFKELAEDEWQKREKAAKAEGRAPPRRVLEYFTILKRLQMEPRDDKLWSIIQKLYDTVEKNFGKGFVMQQDFWSWRSQGQVAAERIHMDGDFWMTRGNDGFNLWILLDHQGMGHSFDIFTQGANPGLYKMLKLPGRVTSIVPSAVNEAVPCFLFFEPLRLWPVLFEFQNSLARSIASCFSYCATSWFQLILKAHLRARERLPLWLLRSFTWVFGWLGNLYLLPSEEIRATRFTLDVGDALVVRQDELHVSDQEPLQADQHRLAVGFKFMRQAPAKIHKMLASNATVRMLRGATVHLYRPSL